ncbi:hypothetical protein CACET_c22940 [Clostridium aceticum]|uniref:Uncharacterized protein n=1 Tax=Clostridium aceticum TaxID=84022 RepID=A0A0D8IBW6_9CLOT|nr:hypothetical protein [Clostridium aceticum]AKL95740.1 hypothetical protein CACET_c22940 [Clostridium aceticum]KJF26711.1 hypothetical protein TZ02_10795 [Clostridium aceticum]
MILGFRKKRYWSCDVVNVVTMHLHKGAGTWQGQVQHHQGGIPLGFSSKVLKVPGSIEESSILELRLKVLILSRLMV